jgi:dihydroxyacetone kinase
MELEDERLRLLDAPTSAPAWPRTLPVKPQSISARIVVFPSAQEVRVSRPTETAAGKRMLRAVSAACEAAIEYALKLTELDQVVGDGDLGSNMARAAGSVLEDLDTVPFDQPAEALKTLGVTVQRVLGGSSGPLYGAFLLRAGTALNGNVPNAQAWASALAEGCDAVAALGGASLGDRTMLDALMPFAQAFGAEISRGAPAGAGVISGVAAARLGSERTAAMMPRRGRASYLGERALGHIDPGAAAVVILLEAIAREIAGA